MNRGLLNTELLEVEILGSFFLDPTLVGEVAVTLEPGLFTHPWHRNLLKMIQELHRMGQELSMTRLVTVFEKHMEKVGGVSYLSELTRSAFSISTLEQNIRQLIETDARRKALDLVGEYREKFMDMSAGGFEELLDQFEQRSLDIRPKALREDTTVDDIIQWYEDLVLKTQDPARALGIMTGWSALDRLTLGFQRTNLIVIGARTSMGKSAVANEIKMRATQRGHKVADFSLEMSKAQIYNRMIANLCSIPLQAIRSGHLKPEQIERISTQMEFLRKIHIDDSRGVTAEYICSEMRRLKRQEGLDLVIVDYLQEVVEPAERNDNSGSGLHRVCQKLRKAAKDCDCALIGLSQVKQDVESRQNKRPFVSDLSGSAAISAVADDILLLYRDEYYNPDTPDPGILEINLAKQRNGPTGVVKLKYEKETQQIA
ncbi:DnaB-like helicase C-terminal domain-containing protein [Paenibacillus polymyxa]|uniref:replicative DNA helicase n=1 Tax=Paenibacillus polymyxa TaxID=1406 RepID=UPI002024E1EB|nr:DnaB-like helicase C-terminal domain-containing protein [Paenibacillus polymyxa]URJ47409.3 DnaB-like helicase C-terminal domain-containing protein [Paenibacillus polymyxa]